MTLAPRFEKLAFIIAELEIGLHLAKRAPDAAAARMIARHILVRVYDFIAHSRALKTTLSGAGFNVIAFHKSKEIYANDFEAYHLKARHKLSAHMQDLDLEERLALWDDIEVSKAGYFVDGARELYVNLAALGAPGYVAYASAPELTDPALDARLNDWGTDHVAHGGLRMGMDSLALGRTNTIAGLGLSPVHERAAQLTLLRRWVSEESALVRRFEAHARVRRLLSSRLITDVVSFVDCLYTRPVASTALQAMDGLDVLVGQPTPTLDTFGNVVDVPAVMAMTRELRNKVGGHLEVDPTVSVADLEQRIDAFDLQAALELHNRFVQVFIATCRQVVFLKTYLADGHKVGGALALHKPVSAPFDPSRPDMAWTASASAPGAANLRAALAAWAADGTETSGAALDVVRGALSRQTADRSVVRVEQLGSAIRNHTIALGPVHDALEAALIGAATPEIADRLIALVEENAGGDPWALTEVMLAARTESPASPVASSLALGRLAPSWHEDVLRLLKEEIRSEDRHRSLAGRMALLMIFMRAEAPARANQMPQGLDWSTVKTAILGQPGGHSDPIVPLVLLTVAWDRRANLLPNLLKTERDEIVAEARRRLEAISDAAAFSAHSGVIDHLLQDGDMAGIALLLKHELSPDASGLERQAMDIACHGPALSAQSHGGLRHLALCHHELGEDESALDILDWLTQQDPAALDYPLLALEIRLNDPAQTTRVRTDLKRFKATYRLDAGAAARVGALAQALERPVTS